MSIDHAKEIARRNSPDAIERRRRQWAFIQSHMPELAAWMQAQPKGTFDRVEVWDSEGVKIR